MKVTIRVVIAWSGEVGQSRSCAKNIRMRKEGFTDSRNQGNQVFQLGLSFCGLMQWECLREIRVAKGDGRCGQLQGGRTLRVCEFSRAGRVHHTFLHPPPRRSTISRL